MMTVYSNSSSRKDLRPPPHQQSLKVKVISFLVIALASYYCGQLSNISLNSQVGGGSQTGGSQQISQPSIAPVPNPNPTVILPSSSTPFHYANQNPTIAYWKLAIQFPVAFCTTVGQICRTPIPAGCTIHGLYALDANMQILTPNTIRGNLLKLVDIQKVEGLLSLEWPQLGRGSNLLFWDRQYNKHGRLTGLSELEYFELAIDLKTDFDQLTGGLETLFATSHIMHGRFYTPRRFCNAVIAKTTVSPDLKCSLTSTYDEQLLEVHSCRTSTGTYVNCSQKKVCKTHGPCNTPLLYA